MGNKQETQDARQMKVPTHMYCIVLFCSFSITPNFKMYLHKIDSFHCCIWVYLIIHIKWLPREQRKHPEIWSQHLVACVLYRISTHWVVKTTCMRKWKHSLLLLHHTTADKFTHPEWQACDLQPAVPPPETNWKKQYVGGDLRGSPCLFTSYNHHAVSSGA